MSLIKSKCPNCGKVILIEDWQDKDDCFCSEQCRYNYETGKPGEEY